MVRIAGGFVFCLDATNWELMGALNVGKRRQGKIAAKMAKHIGQGGPVRPFLQDVQPGTRTIRLILAICRAWEAQADDRLVEVGIAETL